MAESEGFEPPDPCGSPVFKTGTIDHSVNSPKVLEIITYLIQFQDFLGIILKLITKNVHCLKLLYVLILIYYL